MNKIFVCLVLAFFFFGCKSKKEKRREVSATDFFPVPSYIRGELNKIDSSFYSFSKIETVEGKSDTVSIRNKDVRLYAKDFLALPDLSSPELKDDYSVSNIYDEAQKASLLTFMTNEAHPVQQEIVTVDENVNAEGKNDIRSIYANVVQDSNGTAVKKILVWEAATGFHSTTITQTPDRKSVV